MSRSIAKVKWFNSSKGFGFVAPENGPDAFLHVSALERRGLSDISEGTSITCEIVDSVRGPQVQEVFSVDDTERRDTISERRSKSNFDQPDNERVRSGIVKWFKPESGYGFIAADDGGPDVFIHQGTAAKCGFPDLRSQQMVQFKDQLAQKGREATWIAVIDG